MKCAILISIAFTAGLYACNQSGPTNKLLQNRIDSLEQKLADSYRPGFGEFMSGIQVHHSKLWFAGKNKNWKLAGFEIAEIEEALSGIKKYCTDRPETNDITMIDQPMDSLKTAIQNKDPVSFNTGYIALTNTCNSCHKATHHEFNVITVPDNPPFSNQDFRAQ
ncbi:MAG TPA: hypothetical protein VFV68_06770 [Agriterribacter sp.]|nr:hypothetical protein [Agriterribacter sp.]